MWKGIGDMGGDRRQGEGTGGRGRGQEVGGGE